MSRKRKISIWQWSLALLLVLALTGPAAAAQQYQFQDLGTLPGMDSCVASDINNQGQIVGSANEGAYGSWWLKWRAYLKNPGEPMQDLGTIPGYENERYDAIAINDSGVIVGSHGQWPTRAFIKYPDQPMEVLLGGMVSRAIDINNLGQVVGCASPNWPWELYWNMPYSFLKNPDGSVVLTHNPFGSMDMAANGINDNGWIVGNGMGVNAWLMKPGEPLEQLGTLPGGTWSAAGSINNQGQIVGASHGSGINYHHAFLKNPGQPLQDLGTLGGDDSYAYWHGINAKGQIVGFSQIFDGSRHAFIVNPGEAMQDLNNLTVNLPTGVTLEHATAINDNGWIVGYTSGTYPHAFLLTPVLNVSIDIKPGSDVNSINPDSKGKIAVAILSAPDFNAPEKVDWGSLKFGETGNELSLAFCTVADVNADGLPDLVAHFYTQLTDFETGDTKGYLKGQTVDGIPLSGSDSVRIVPGK